MNSKKTPASLSLSFNLKFQKTLRFNLSPMAIIAAILGGTTFATAVSTIAPQPADAGQAPIAQRCVKQDSVPVKMTDGRLLDLCVDAKTGIVTMSLPSTSR